MLVVVEPSVKSVDVGVRVVAAATAAEVEVIVVANRVRTDADLEAIRAELGDWEIVVVPEDPTIARADIEGRAPIDIDPGAPGVSALSSLAERLVAPPVQSELGESSRASPNGALVSRVVPLSIPSARSAGRRTLTAMALSDPEEEDLPLLALRSNRRGGACPPVAPRW